jgi:tetratricopeptide (TPR) repeat protein
MVRGRPLEARRIGGQLLALAEQSGDPGVRLQVYRPLGLNLFYLGRFDEAVAQLDGALALHDPVAHADHRHEYGSDPAVLAMCNRGWIRWFKGELGTALDDCLAAVARARRLEHPHSQAFALSFLASVHQGRREPREVLAACEELRAIASLNAFPYWTTWEQVLCGWATAQADAKTGARAIAAGLEAYRATGAELMVPYFAALLGEALLLANDAAAARRVLDDGIAIAREHEIAFYGPELLRLRARASERHDMALVQEAAAWSRRLGARTFELRALVDLKGDLEALRRLRSTLADDPQLPDLAEADRCLGKTA